MKRFKTTAERLHRICIKAQTGKPHGLSLHKFGLICTMRGYRKAFWLGIGLKKPPRKSQPKATPDGRADEIQYHGRPETMWT